MIPGLPTADSAAVLALLKQQQGLEQVVLYGSRAMGRHHSGSDVDLCLLAPSLHLEDLLLLGARLDDLLLPWRFDLQAQAPHRPLRIARAHRAGRGGLAFVALNSEPEAQAALHLPAGAAVTTPDQCTTAGINAHRCVIDVGGGVVEAELDQGRMVIAAIDVPALALA